MRKPLTLKQFLFTNREVDATTGCWNYTRYRDPRGYGKACNSRWHRLTGKSYLHQISHVRFNVPVYGPIPKGHGVLHRCDNPSCFNPAHLYTGTQKQNAKDRTDRGRQHDTRGELHGCAKLTEADVRRIRELRREGYRLIDLAPMFGVGVAAISRAANGGSWSHVA